MKYDDKHIVKEILSAKSEKSLNEKLLQFPRSSQESRLKRALRHIEDKKLLLKLENHPLAVVKMTLADYDETPPEILHRFISSDDALLCSTAIGTLSELAGADKSDEIEKSDCAIDLIMSYALGIDFKKRQAALRLYLTKVTYGRKISDNPRWDEAKLPVISMLERIITRGDCADDFWPKCYLIATSCDDSSVKMRAASALLQLVPKKATIAFVRKQLEEPSQEVLNQLKNAQKLLDDKAEAVAKKKEDKIARELYRAERRQKNWEKSPLYKVKSLSPELLEKVNKLVGEMENQKEKYIVQFKEVYRAEAIKVRKEIESLSEDEAWIFMLKLKTSYWFKEFIKSKPTKNVIREFESRLRDEAEAAWEKVYESFVDKLYLQIGAIEDARRDILVDIVMEVSASEEIQGDITYLLKNGSEIRSRVQVVNVFIYHGDSFSRYESRFLKSKIFNERTGKLESVAPTLGKVTDEIKKRLKD